MYLVRTRSQLVSRTVGFAAVSVFISLPQHSLKCYCSQP